MFDYAIFAGFILYFVVLRMLNNAVIGPVAGAAIVAIGSFAILAAPRAILAGAGVFGWRELLTIVAQLIVGTLIFYKMQQRDDSLTVWLVLGVAGAYLLLWAIPELVAYLLLLAGL